MRLKQAAKLSKASQDWFELWQMLRAVAVIKPAVILEIGVHKGGFLETCAGVFEQAMLIGVDLDYSNLEFTGFNGLCGDSNKPSMREAVTDIAPAIDFLFIDGDHRYNAVKQDFELYMPLVRPGGIVGFHDTNSRGIEGVEVDQFMKELDDLKTYQTMDLRAGPKSPGTRLIWIP